MRPLTLLSLAAALALLPACGDEHDEHDEHDEDPTAEACEHATDGPFNAVTAAAAADAPAIQSYAHSRVDITLAPDLDTVAFNAEEGEYAFYLSDDVPLVLTAGGMTLALEETTPVDACDILAVRHLVDLPTGEILITFGPTDLTRLSLVFEAGGPHDHD